MQWQAIKNYPGYEVSDKGEVRSYWKAGGYKGLKRLMTQPVRVLKQYEHGQMRPGKRHLAVRLCNDAGHKWKLLHVLVMLAFGPPQPPDKPLVLHKDDDPRNNEIDNLRWGDAADNAHDAIRNKKWNPPRGEGSGTAKLTESKVKEMRLLYEGGGISYKQLAEQYGISPMQACRIINRQRWAHVN